LLQKNINHFVPIEAEWNCWRSIERNFEKIKFWL